MPATPGTTAFTLPFDFAPNFFFGDVPWRVWVMAKEADATGGAQIPPMPPTTDPGSEALVGTILFDKPYFPIVGSQNVSDHYANLTGFWEAPNLDRTHSIMLLPDASGALPVLTVDVPLLKLGFFFSGIIPVIGKDRGSLLMWPGAQVKVLDDSELAIGYIDMFTCTEQVSKGILVEQGGRLVQENSTFSDAELAIHLKKGSEFKSFFVVTFTNNYKGMRIDNTGSASVPDITAMFGFGNAFENTATLKLPYTGMAVPNTTRGYGLEIISHPGINLYHGFFTGLNNGVRLFRSAFTTGASFAGIRGDAGSAVAHQGWSIWALGSGTQELNYSSGNIISIAQYGSNDKGVYVQNMHTAIDRVGISANQGIFLVNCKHKNVSITNVPTPAKALNCRNYAIRSSNCLPLNAGSIVRDNLIIMNNPGNTNLSGTGILLGEGSQVTTQNSVGWIIQHNFLDLNRTHWGIRGLGVHNSQFRDNDIEILNGDHPNVIGVDVLNTSKMIADCNDVHTTASEVVSTGYLFKNVNQSDYICNTTEKLRTGIEFSVLCEGTTLKGSGLNNTSIGLRLKNDVVLGTQGLDQMNQLLQDHGNRWVGSAATHEAIQQSQVDLSKFGVDPPESTEFDPPNNWGQDWFKPEITSTIPSFSCTGFQCSLMQVYTKDRSVEKAVANGSIYSVGLPGLMPKILENHLYAELQQNPAWAAGDPLYAQFLQSKYGTTTAAFWQIQQGINALNNRSDSEQDAISAAEANIRSLRYDLYLLDSTYSSGTAINRAHYAVKLAMLSSATVSLQTQLDALLSNRLTQAAQLLTQNAAIGSSQTWEQNEKLANDLEIRIFMQDSVNTAQLTLLDGLGMLCPNENGEAVLRAQVLYNRFVEKEFLPVCTGARGGAGERGEDSYAPAALKLYPNPTTGWVNIPNLKAATRAIQVFDIAGKLVHQITNSDIDFDFSNLNSGVYLLHIKDEATGKTDSAKLFISK